MPIPKITMSAFQKYQTLDAEKGLEARLWKVLVDRDLLSDFPFQLVIFAPESWSGMKVANAP
jgi:hypothetical protein